MTPAETTGSDAELIGLARSGDDAAYSALVARHRDAARDTAALRTGGFSDRADDVVAAAVTRMRDTLRAGFGPVEAFRPYLLALVCRLAHAADLDAALAADIGPIPLFAPGTEHADTSVETEESQVFAGAFLQLPEHWQALLWHRAVDGEAPADIAALLGGSAESVDALALCAREDLRTSVLAAHESRTELKDCAQASDLAAYVRGSLGRRALHRFEDHTPSCASCRSVLAHLDDVEGAVAQLVAPLFLGAPAAAPVAPLVSAAPARRSAVLVGAGVAVTAALVLGSGALAATVFLGSPADKRMATAASASDAEALQPGPGADTQPRAGGDAGQTASPERQDADDPGTEDSDHAPTDSDSAHRDDESAADSPDAERHVEATGNRDNAPGRSSDRPSQGARPDGGRPGPSVVAPSERPGIAPNPRPDQQQVPSSRPAAPPVAPRPTPKTSSAPTYKPAPKPSPSPTKTYKPAPSPTPTFKPAPKPSPTPTPTYKPAPKPSPTPTRTPTPKPSPTQTPERDCIIDLLGIKVCL
ncbi:hypothetical protein [Zhihengliuella halotolerans]|uniref:DNA-directed RNA polymerase specialized sigma24 family protein n=1 Tax=Zhihengliuella halotolerans TaxID=370736 RepID=A0A4Q8AA47_9MICC|nr:hypothetical protein [Zhihengliuella halotolerans]RZU60834.1 DNA-directed RNA polymerase specialized sigma24 family protein [Zhihengliuella halotolerans]